MTMAYEEYMKQLVKPMRDELTRAGFQELTTGEAVESFFDKVEGTTLVVVNSVCGCAAGLARPAATQAILQAENAPDNLVTVFAGQDKEATGEMREIFGDIPPSSPSMAIMKGKEVVHFIHRHDIEANTMENIMANLQGAFDQYCK